MSLANNFELGGQSELGLVFNAGYRREFRNYSNGISGNYTLDSPTASNLNPNFILSDQRSVESPTVNGMLGLAYRLNKNNTISYTSIYNHTADIIGQNLEGEHIAYDVRSPEVFTSATQHFRERSIFQNQLRGEHVLGEKKIRLDWIGSYNQAEQLDI